MFRKTLFVVSVLTLALVLIASIALAQGTGDPARGKTLWEQKNCKSCHGANGEGKYAAPRAGDGKTAADWIKQVRTPRQNMPSYTESQISDQDITDMNAYMQTLAKPASFTPQTYTPAADDMPGKVLFNQKRCVACHGADPSGFVKTRFTDKGRTVAAADVIKQLRTPAQNMPSFSTTQVSDAEAGQIADYLKSLAPAAAPAPETLPKAGGERLGMWTVLLVLGGLSLLGIGLGVTGLARKRA